MTLQTFTWLPNLGAQHSTKAEVSSAKFGDGYEQSVPSGLNSMPQTWSLDFTLPTTEALSLIAFLRTHKGSMPFRWMTPLGEGGVYKCKTWKSQSKTFGIADVTCEFEQSFDARY